MHQPPGMVSTGLKVFYPANKFYRPHFFQLEQKSVKKRKSNKAGWLLRVWCLWRSMYLHLCLCLCIFIWLMVWCLRRALNSANVPHKKFPSCPRRGTLPIIFILITLQCWVWSFIVRSFIVRILDVANVVIQMLNSAIYSYPGTKLYSSAFKDEAISEDKAVEVKCHIWPFRQSYSCCCCW